MRRSYAVEEGLPDARARSCEGHPYLLRDVRHGSSNWSLYCCTWNSGHDRPTADEDPDRDSGFEFAQSGYPEYMSKFNVGTRIKRGVAPMVFAGAVATAIAAAPFAAADAPAQVAGAQPGGIATVQFMPLDPGGGGCLNGQCGSGGTNGGPGGGPGGSGCVPGPNGPICGSGGVNGWLGGVPGGGGCVPGMGCGSGHG